MEQGALEFRVGRKLSELGLRVATAESCTGGLISHLLTNVPGSSEYFLGGVVAYSNETKVRQLGVRRETLAAHGAVSGPTVLEMARGVRRALSADVGVSVSGIAGPGGGTPEKPVGLTWFAVSLANQQWARSAVFQGDRLQVKDEAARAALGLLLDCLEGSLSQEAGQGVR
jgi:PncC family amidohydrolase